MTQVVEMPLRACVACGSEFRPRPGGHNARYCSKSCRRRAVEDDRNTRRRSRAGQSTYYSRVTKQDPALLARHLERSRAGQARTRQWLADYKLSQGCIDCGFNEHPAALQLDHNGPKTAAISSLRSSVKRMLAEIESGKCVVRCANCHAIKTWAEKNGLPNPSGRSCWRAA